MGITVAEIERITFQETLANVLSACILGILIGVALGLQSQLVLFSFWELPMTWNIFWKVYIQVLIIATFVVFVGTKLCIKIVSQKTIANILKGI